MKLDCSRASTNTACFLWAFLSFATDNSIDSISDRADHRGGKNKMRAVATQTTFKSSKIWHPSQILSHSCWTGPLKTSGSAKPWMWASPVCTNRVKGKLFSHLGRHFLRTGSQSYLFPIFLAKILIKTVHVTWTSARHCLWGYTLNAVFAALSDSTQNSICPWQVNPYRSYPNKACLLIKVVTVNVLGLSVKRLNTEITSEPLQTFHLASPHKARRRSHTLTRLLRSPFS